MHAKRTMAAMVAVVALTAPVAGRSAPAGAIAPGTLAVTPNTDLVDFQPVVLSGVGLEPGLHEWYQCRGGAVDESDCDGYNADFISVAADGTASETVYVDARIYLPDGTEVDCRTDPAGCVLGVGFMVDAGEWPTVPLDFDPTAPLRPPVTTEVDPRTGLHDDQTVTVHGEHLSFREEAFAYLCAAGDGAIGARCDLDRSVRGVPDATGTISLPLEVRSTFAPPLGGSVDCRSAATPCSVVLGWSFDPPPDRQAQVPVAFAPLAPTSSTTSTTTTSSTPPAGPAPAPPATPLPGTAAFTG